MSESPKQANEIRIAFRSKIGPLVTQCEKLIKDEKFKDLHLSALGNSISNVYVIFEILKSMYPDLSYKSVFSVIYLTNENEKDKKPDKEKKKLFPRLELIISKEKPAENKEENFKLSEEERKALIETMDSQKKAFLRRRRPAYRRRRTFAGRRRGGFPGRNPRFAYSAKRTNYGWRRPTFNNARRPFGKSPAGRRNNMRKFEGNRKNSGSKPTTAKN